MLKIFNEINLLDIDKDEIKGTLDPVLFGMKVINQLFTLQELQAGIIVNRGERTEGSNVKKPLDYNRIDILKGGLHF